MKQKSNLARKMKLFYQEIESKREGETLRLQTDLELRGSMGNITWTFCSRAKNQRVQEASFQEQKTA